MVSLIGWIVTMGSYEDFVSTTVHEPGFFETIRDDSHICEDDVAPEVLIVLFSVEKCHLRRTGVNSGGKGGFNANLCE